MTADRVEVYLPAGEHQRFAPAAFDRLVGGTIKLTVAHLTRPARLAAARVDRDGAGVTLTLELPDDR
jgi:hypothetical protein